MRVGFIGLGAMGLPMARNLLRGGHAVQGYDLSPAALVASARGDGKANDSQVIRSYRVLNGDSG